MDKPDQRLFEADVAAAEFRSGVVKGLWGLAAPELLPEGIAWPTRILWITTAPRANAPERFYFSLDMTGYRSVPPTGTFWDPTGKVALDVLKRPKGKPNTRCAKIFRTDWNNSALYHPYDRVAAESHKKEWEKGAKDDPRRRWTSDHTIVDYLEEFHALLNCGDYIGA